MEKYNCAETFPDDGEELSLLDILIVLAEQKKLIVAITLLFAVAGFGYTTFVKDTTPRYRSDVQMITEEVRYVMGDGELSLYRPTDMIKSIVTSRSMQNAVNEEFAAEGAAGISMSAEVSRDKLITISVTSHSPELSMKAADFIYRRSNEMLLAMTAPSDGKNFSDKKRRDKIRRLEKERRELMPAPDMPVSPMFELDMLMQNGERRVYDSQNVLQLVSPASMPAGPEAQGRGKVIVLATLLGFFCAVTAAFARHFWAAADDPETTEKKNYLKKLLGFKTKA